MLKNHGAATAIRFRSQAISYAQMLGRIAQYASSCPLDRGAHALIISENRPEYIYAFYAIWQQQGVAIPVDYLSTAPELAYIVGDSRPALIYCSAKTKALVEEALALSGHIVRVAVLDELEGQLAPETGPAAMPGVDATQPAVIIYTSGTTGSPKGVVLSYQNLLQNVRAVSEHIPIYHSGSRVLVLLPLHHIFPLMGTMICPLHVGATLAISPSMLSDDIMATLQENKVTIIIGVPRLYAAIRKGIMDKVNNSFVARTLFALARRLDSRRFSRTVFGAVHRKLGGAVEHLVSGGAALDPAVGNDFKTLGFEVLEGYGMTEAAPMITFTRPGRVRIGSPGEAMPGTTIRIVDGEITASGDNIMLGYYNRPEETADVLRDGWLYTGDLGRLDEDGYLYITGRKKEIIVLSNGKNINPAELEEELLSSALVKDCGVFAMNDQLHVMLLPEGAALPDDPATLKQRIMNEVIEPYNKRVSAYKKIMGLHLTFQDLPRTRLGKLQRFRLAELIEQKPQTDQPAEEINDPVYVMLSQWIAREKGIRVQPHYHPEVDCGLDSLDKVSFQTYMNQTFGVSPEPHEIAAFSTVLELAQWVGQHKTRIEESKVDWKTILHEKVQLSLPKTWFTGQIALWFSKIFFRLYFRFSARGVENIPDGPCIIAPNHQSFFDGMFVAAALRFGQARKTYFYAKEKHIRQPWLKFLANRNNIIIMDLNNNLKESIQKMAEVLRSNRNIIIFPEGTRTFNGKLGEFKKTFAILSSELNVPIVPVSIKGAYEALPRGRFFPKPWKKITVEYMKPVFPEKMSYEALAEAVRKKIELKIA
ncbi:MAG: AMP-binding protein [Bacteroidetes bacterium]|nr:AMP-binding protein [Bacteroidota bacterium]